MLDPKCGDGFHRDDQKNLCVPDSDCEARSLCGGKGAALGYLDSKLKKCMCRGVPQDSSSFCDAACQAKCLQAYVTNDGRIFLKPAGDPDGNGRYYKKSDFPSLMLDGLVCSSTAGRCLIQNVDTTSGDMGGKYECPAPFVTKWKETHPDYVSPYATTSSARRVLQDGSRAPAERAL